MPILEQSDWLALTSLCTQHGKQCLTKQEKKESCRSKIRSETDSNCTVYPQLQRDDIDQMSGNAFQIVT